MSQTSTRGTSSMPANKAERLPLRPEGSGAGRHVARTSGTDARFEGLCPCRPCASVLPVLVSSLCSWRQGLLPWHARPLRATASGAAMQNCCAWQDLSAQAHGDVRCATVPLKAAEPALEHVTRPLAIPIQQRRPPSFSHSLAKQRICREIAGRPCPARPAFQQGAAISRAPCNRWRFCNSFIQPLPFERPVR